MKTRVELTDALLDLLLKEGFSESNFADLYGDKRKAIRALMNVRPPIPASAELLRAQDELLQVEFQDKNLVDVDSLPTIAEDFPNSATPHRDQLILWQGDITTLCADAIVNAANAAMLGCFHPLHNCIDNVIHSAAGIQLRLACKEIIQAQGHEEPTGSAQITPGFNLPAKYALHTVGPIVSGAVTPEHARLLGSSYHACLDLAAKTPSIRNVTFCCISTGVYGYPKEDAAQVAIRSVGEWLDEHPDRMDRVIFNVFTDEDLSIYRRLFGERN